LSIRPIRAHNFKTKKIQIGINLSQGLNAFQLKRSKVKVTGCQKPQEIATHLAHIYLWAADQALMTQALTAN